ncbi:MAG TPA: hypothetical protein VGC41_12910 [Kofleriaceae bacterium]
MRSLFVLLILCAHVTAGVLHDLADDIKARLAQLSAPKPPVAIAVKWKPLRMTPALELGAPLLAMTAADLDGDGKAELYAVTTQEVIAFGVIDHRVKELARAAFGGERVMPMSRDPIGAAVVEGNVVVASSSVFQRSLKLRWDRKKLVGDIGEVGMVVCPGERAVATRNFYGDEKTGFYGARCREIVGADGVAKPVRAQLLLTGRLEVGGFAIPHAGHAFDIGDLDRDGKAEIVFASANAPGDPDELRAVTIGDDEKRSKWRKSFTAGGVAAVAVGDFDGTPAVIAAVRLVGATRIDLWRMN